jgi:hypothetical protein
MQDIVRGLAEVEPEVDAYEAVPFDQEDYGTGEAEVVFDEGMEMELADELLTVASEAELDQFLGNLIRRAGSTLGRFVRSPVGQALGGILKGAARRALPIVGGALGGAIGGPAGGAMGSRLASAAGQVFGLELEGLSPEDQEFEVARRFVRFAGSAVRRAAAAPRNLPALAAARSAATAAARRHAPGLLRIGIPRSGPGGGPVRMGRWIRRGRQIVIINCF